MNLLSEDIKQLILNGELEKVPPELITKDILLSKDKTGTPTICCILFNDQLKHVPKEFLSDQILSQKDLSGASCYLIAARKLGQFEKIPQELITTEVLKESQNKEKLWGILIRNKEINHILPFVEELIDDTELDDNSSFLHTCATTCELNKIPQSLITKQRILKQKTLGKENVIHYAAHYGCLNQIPSEFLTQETMSITSTYGETPLHSAADGGKLNLVPQEFLTQENLEKEDNWGTVFHKAAINCTFDTFPKNFLTEKNLLVKGISAGISPIVLLAHKCSEPNTGHSKHGDAVKQFTYLAKTLSNKNLEALKKELTRGEWDNALEILKKENLRRDFLENIQNSSKNLEI
jgi:hypothetical protein